MRLLQLYEELSTLLQSISTFAHKKIPSIGEQIKLQDLFSLLGDFEMKWTVI